MEAEKPEIVEYSTFVKDLTGSDPIGEVDIYKFGRKADLTYTTADGEFRATQGVYQLSDDDLLAFTLDSRGIPYTVHAEEFPGANSAEDWFVFLPMLSFFLVPAALVVAVVLQAKAIRRMSESLARISEERDRGGSEIDR